MGHLLSQHNPDKICQLHYKVHSTSSYQNPLDILYQAISQFLYYKMLQSHQVYQIWHCSVFELLRAADWNPITKYIVMSKPDSILICNFQLGCELTGFCVISIETKELSVFFVAQVCSFTREILSKDEVSCLT